MKDAVPSEQQEKISTWRVESGTEAALVRAGHSNMRAERICWPPGIGKTDIQTKYSEVIQFQDHRRRVEYDLPEKGGYDHGSPRDYNFLLFKEGASPTQRS